MLLNNGHFPEFNVMCLFVFLQVVRSLLVSLAHHEKYHALFNKFVRHNPLVFDEEEYGFLKHCMGLLDFENKLIWIRGKLKILM